MSKYSTDEELLAAQRELLALIDQCKPCEEVSIAYAKYVLLRHDMNKVQTAKALGIDRRTLYRWLEPAKRVG